MDLAGVSPSKQKPRTDFMFSKQPKGVLRTSLRPALKGFESIS